MVSGDVEREKRIRELEARIAELEAALARRSDEGERQRIEEAMAKAALRESQAMLHSFYDGSCFLMGVVELDGDTILPVHANPATRRFFLGTPAELASPPPDRPAATTGINRLWSEHCLRSLREGAPVQFEYPHPVATESRWLSVTVTSLGTGASGRPRCSFVAEDVTERKRAEAALRESERRFRLLAEALPHHVYQIDTHGNAVYYNERWIAYSGSRPGDLDNRMEMVHPDDRAMVLSRWSTAVRTGTPYESECRLRRFDGEYRWFLRRAVPVRDSSGEVVGWFGTSTDIDELKRAQEALREADRRKNDFLAVLSHELRNPLAPISNSLHILERVEPDSEPARRAQAVIGRQVAQLVRLVGDLLDVTRISSNKVQLERHRLELGELLRRTIDDHRTLFESSGIRLELLAEPGLLYVDGDGNRLAQVIGNLLQNAAKFTARGGSTRVVLERSLGQAVIRVVDSGVGLAPDMLPRLFQPFMQADTTLDRSKGGLGLGLALVKGLVELHGGEIAVHSEGLGRGTVFTLRLPLAADDEGAARPAAATGTSPRRRVLIIEDNIDAADSLRAVLELGGHEVTVAHDGPAGLQAAATFRPEAILCDIGLPGMDGCEVARILRADPTQAGALLVALTAYALPEDLKRAAAAGFDRHLAKPPSIDKLKELLSSLR